MDQTTKLYASVQHESHPNDPFTIISYEEALEGESRNEHESVLYDPEDEF